MKRIVTIITAIVALQMANAQDGNNICVWNSINTFTNGGGPSDLEAGIKCADLAAVNENTINKSKTWYYRGQLYTYVSQEKTLKNTYPNSVFEAIQAFKKLYELNDPKFKDWDEAITRYMGPLATTTFNEGVDRFQTKDYVGAFKYFYAVKDINLVVEGKGKKSGIDLAVALKNAAIAAENAGDVAGSINVYKDWLAIAPDALAYRSYVVALKKSGKEEEANKILDEAMAKFPKDANLLVEKINVYLAAGQYPEALAYVNNLLSVEPNNDGALFIKGLAYEKIGNEDSVVYYYSKSAEINPKNIKPWNNLGALYVNKANGLVEQMNKLGNTAADMKKYDELKAQRKDLYLKAKPYLLKAKEIEPNDAQILRTLKQVELYTGE